MTKSRIVGAGLVWPRRGSRGGPFCGPIRMVQSVVAVPLVVVLGRIGEWSKAGWRGRKLEVSEVAWVGE